MRTVLAFFPHNPQPPRSGAHRRFLEVCHGLRVAGARVSLCSSALVSETPWTAESIHALKLIGLDEVTIHRPGIRDLAVAAPRVLWSRLRKRLLPVDSPAFCPPGFRRHFRKALETVQPDVLLMNYACWDRLIDHDAFAGLHRIIDTLDLVTLNSQMREALLPYLSAIPVAVGQVPDHVLREDFYARLPPVDCSTEYGIYDRYDDTLAISAQEARLIRQNTRSTQAWHVPMTETNPAVINSYDGPSLLPVGNNLFNVHGYVYFVRRVLPSVRVRCPDFVLRVTGPCCHRLSPVEGVELAGFVPDLAAALARAPFLVCPVFGGTGQQIKIIEAMAHGVPVVALEAAAESSPMCHGVNGLVARDAEEFAEHVCRLWADRALCRQLGAAARETVARECSRERLVEQLSQLLSRKGPVSRPT